MIKTYIKKQPLKIQAEKEDKVKRDKGLRDIILDIIEDADTDDVIHLGLIFIIILVMIVLMIMFVFDSCVRQTCVNQIIQQYSSAPIEELKQRIELCNQ